MIGGTGGAMGGDCRRSQLRIVVCDFKPTPEPVGVTYQTLSASAKKGDVDQTAFLQQDVDDEQRVWGSVDRWKNYKRRARHVCDHAERMRRLGQEHSKAAGSKIKSVDRTARRARASSYDRRKRPYGFSQTCSLPPSPFPRHFLVMHATTPATGSRGRVARKLASFHFSIACCLPGGQQIDDWQLTRSSPPAAMHTGIPWPGLCCYCCWARHGDG